MTLNNHCHSNVNAPGTNFFYYQSLLFSPIFARNRICWNKHWHTIFFTSWQKIQPHVWKIKKEMESGRSAACAHSLHLCYWRKPDRFCRKKNHEPAFDQFRLALGRHLYISCHSNMANDGLIDQHPFRAVQVFFKLYTETRREVGDYKREEDGGLRTEVRSMKPEVGSR